MSVTEAAARGLNPLLQSAQGVSGAAKELEKLQGLQRFLWKGYDPRTYEKPYWQDQMQTLGNTLVHLDTLIQRSEKNQVRVTIRDTRHNDCIESPHCLTGLSLTAT